MLIIHADHPIGCQLMWVTSDSASTILTILSIMPILLQPSTLSWLGTGTESCHIANPMAWLDMYSLVKDISCFPVLIHQFPNVLHVRGIFHHTCTVRGRCMPAAEQLRQNSDYNSCSPFCKTHTTVAPLKVHWPQASQSSELTKLLPRTRTTQSGFHVPCLCGFYFWLFFKIFRYGSVLQTKMILAYEMQTLLYSITVVCSRQLMPYLETASGTSSRQ